MKIKIKIENIFFWIFAMLPIMDSLNGYINNGGNEQGLSLGIIYRAITVFICLYFICRFKTRKKMVQILLVAFFVIILPRCINILTDSLMSMRLLKFMLPIICIETYKTLSYNGVIDKKFSTKVFEAWGVTFPLTIIVPYILGLGFITYGSDSVGYKGLYFAQNDVGFILAILYIYIVNRTFDKISIKNVLNLLAIMMCSALLGLKSNYLIMLAATLYYIIKRHKKGRFKKLVLSLAIAASALLIYFMYFDEIMRIFQRWNYFQSQRNFLSFISSGRTDRIAPALEYCRRNDNGLFYLFGTGMAYIAANQNYTIEMDFHDVFFQFGIPGLFFTVAYYFSIYLVNRRADNNKSFYNVAFIMAMVFGFFSGHVLQSALSGMFFSIICCGLIGNGLSFNNAKRSRMVKNEVNL